MTFIMKLSYSISVKAEEDNVWKSGLCHAWGPAWKSCKSIGQPCLWLTLTSLVWAGMYLTSPRLLQMMGIVLLQE